MAESQRSTYEEAKCCPTCGKPGEVRKIVDAPNMPRGTKLHTIYCKTMLCPWYDTCWLVQVNSDGSIPEPKDHTHTPKYYSGFEGHDELARQVQEALEIQAQMETRRGSELRNPNG